MAKKTLVVVESPAKAKTINKYLGSDFTVLSSMGHIVDLPKSRLAVDVDNNFEPDYITVRGRGKILDSLKKQASKSKEVLLASDNDREGEAISWHIQNAILKTYPNVIIKRIIFNEITKQAIKEAVKHAHELDLQKVNAQKARRVLDRIVGYNLSPLLWQKLKKGLSAGRVQSATLKLICDREEEVVNFVPREYWEVGALFLKGKGEFKAKLHKYDNKKIELSNEKETNLIIKELQKSAFTVSSLTKKERSRKALAPFTTSKLQQDASTQIGFNTERTMRIAQGLYEGIDLGKDTVGLITYMRTDSTRVSDTSISEVRDYVKTTFGEKYIPAKANVYTNKKGAQDAHEAIRPTSTARTPKSMASHLSSEQLKLYTLIWNRFVSSQMANALYEQTSLELSGGKGLFKVSSSKILFKGFLEVYGTPYEEGEENIKLPNLEKGEEIKLKELLPSQHFTEPPPRYSEASIVKKLEESGVGRPSTYAPTLATLVKRYYIKRAAKQLSPTELGKLTNKLISEFFPDITNVDFTARMEELLDKVEEEKLDWVKILKDFYKNFLPSVKHAQEKMTDMKNALDEESDEICEKCGKNMVKKLGRFGYFLACPGFPECRNSKPIPLGDCPVDGCKGKLVAKKAKRRQFYGCSSYPDCEFVSWEAPSEDTCPKCGKPLFHKSSKSKGHYLICKNDKCLYESKQEQKSA
ncbi:MAG: type I DNA topoisomerase [Spirochaetota bacterium]|nr:type I DNA topoisomerase [Spirochaetota bacterium]